MTLRAHGFRAHGFRAPRPKLAGGRVRAQAASGRTAPRAAGAPPLSGRRAVLAAIALVTLAGATAGCTATGTSAATPPAAITGAAAGGTGNGGGAQAAVAECPAAGLIVKTGAGEAAAGHSYLTLIFTNSSATPCFLQGYPGAELTTAGGGTLDAQRITGAPAPPRVTLAPGQPGLRADRVGAFPAGRQRGRLTGRLPRLRRHRAAGDRTGPDRADSADPARHDLAGVLGLRRQSRGARHDRPVPRVVLSGRSTGRSASEDAGTAAGRGAAAGRAEAVRAGEHARTARPAGLRRNSTAARLRHLRTREPG